MRKTAAQKLLLDKLVLTGVMLLPLVRLVYQFLSNDLGANPVEAMTHETGDWAIRILLLSLTVTPLQRHAKWRRAILFRRLIGLTAFLYALVHFGVYLVFDQELSFTDTLADVRKRPYITAGFSALLLMLPLALTSTDGMIRRLGRRKWQLLHRLAYPTAALAVVHYWWLVKADTRLPAVYAAWFVILMGLRIRWRKSQSNTTDQSP